MNSYEHREYTLLVGAYGQVCVGGGKGGLSVFMCEKAITKITMSTYCVNSHTSGCKTAHNSKWLTLMQAWIL